MDLDKPLLPVAAPAAAEIADASVVVIPQGMYPGMMMQVATPAGGVMSVTVPEGVAPGQQLQIAMPAAVCQPAAVPVLVTTAPPAGLLFPMAGVVFLQAGLCIAFLFFSAFFAGGRGLGSSPGWHFFLSSHIALVAVETFLLVLGRRLSSTQRPSAATAADLFGVMAVAVSAAGVAALLGFMVALWVDFGQKCHQELLLADRIFDLAWPLVCTQPVRVNPVLTIFFVGLLVSKAAMVFLFFSSRRDAPSLSDGRSTRVYTLASLFTVAVAALMMLGLIWVKQAPQPAAGSCPQPSGPDDNRTALMFLSRPATGVELPYCTWRSSQDGSCARYPYNYQQLGQTEMDDPLAGRWKTKWLTPSDGNSTAAVERADKCMALKGLLGCALYSPDAGNFVTAVAAGEGAANVPVPGSSDISFDVCRSFCDQLFESCAVGLCEGTSSAEECCNKKVFGATYVDNEESCYSPAMRTAAPSLFAAAVAVLAATGW